MIRGDAMAGVAAMGQLKATLRRLAEVPRKVAAEAQPKLDALIQAQFRAGVDPYGNPWAPLRPATLARGRHPPPLTDTTKLRDGTKVLLAPGNAMGLRLVVGAAYGYFAQAGFRVGPTKVPPRRILPQFTFPKAWKAVLDEAARACARRAVGR
jgi:hypothetical protein